MEPISEHKEFIFNKSIDEESLRSLYEYDYLYIEEIFRLTLQDLEPEIGNALTHYLSKDFIALRRTIHKIKPSFGFVGMPLLQEMCQEFENLCDQDPNNLNFEILQKEISQAILVLQSEIKKLEVFNQSAK